MGDATALQKNRDEKCVCVCVCVCVYIYIYMVPLKIKQKLCDRGVGIRFNTLTLFTTTPSNYSLRMCCVPGSVLSLRIKW